MHALFGQPSRQRAGQRASVRAHRVDAAAAARHSSTAQYVWRGGGARMRCHRAARGGRNKYVLVCRCHCVRACRSNAAFDPACRAAVPGRTITSIDSSRSAAGANDASSRCTPQQGDAQAWHSQDTRAHAGPPADAGYAPRRRRAAPCRPDPTRQHGTRGMAGAGSAPSLMRARAGLVGPMQIRCAAAWQHHTTEMQHRLLTLLTTTNCCTTTARGLLCTGRPHSTRGGAR